MNVIEWKSHRRRVGAQEKRRSVSNQGLTEPRRALFERKSRNVVHIFVRRGRNWDTEETAGEMDDFTDPGAKSIGVQSVKV